MRYGMVTNLSGLTTGTESPPGWGPETSVKPEHPHYTGKILWTDGGGGCSPSEKPTLSQKVESIIAATINNHWDGIDFDNECNMNIHYFTQAMGSLNNLQKESSYGLIAGWSYNHPETENGKKLTTKIKEVIGSGYCDRLVHYCYATSGLTDENLNYFLDGVVDRQLGGLLVWNYHQLTIDHLKIITERLELNGIN
nr:hypothetical protein [unidentified bacterial endosymbiont]